MGRGPIRRLADKLDEGSRGAAAVELVLVAPIVILMLSVVMDVSLYMKTAMVADECATAGCRYAMNHPDLVSADTTTLAAKIKNDVIDSGFSEVKAEGIKSTVTVTYPGGSYAPVSDPYTYRFYANGVDEDTRDSQRSYQTFTVRVVLERPFYTSVGALAATLAGSEDGNLISAARQVGHADKTSGGTW